MPLSTRIYGLALASLLASPAMAQPAPPIPEPTPPAATKPGNESVAPDASGAAATDPNAPLSKKLKESGGVIAPPRNVDPEIAKPTPDVNSQMPVIPPAAVPEDQPLAPK